MRIAFFILLLANLLFLAWAEWIAVPTSRADPLAGLPRLQLVSRDLPPAPPAAGAVHASAGALGAALAAQGVEAASSAQNAPPALQCVSIGPFARKHTATEAAALLSARNFVPQLRTAAVQPVRWYWVYLPDLSGTTKVQKTLDELRHDGIDGAEPMPTADGRPGISLGLFLNPALAKRQLAHALGKGFRARLTRRLVAQPAYWLDLWVSGGAAALPMQALHAQSTSPIAAQSCPAGDTPPPPSSATGAVAPGVPLPEERASTAPGP